RPRDPLAPPSFPTRRSSDLLTVDLLTPAEARDLLSRRLGAQRIAAEPAAVDDIIASCARLPLALAIVAARAATHPRFPLAALAQDRKSTRLNSSHDQISYAV